MKASFSGNTSGGILMVSNGAQRVAIDLVGNYTQSSWHLSPDKTGGTSVVDPEPPVSSSPNVPKDVQFVASSGTIKLGDSQHFAGQISKVTDPPATLSHVDKAVALLTQSIAAGFRDEHGAPITTPGPLIQEHETLFLATPHHG